MTSPFDQSIFGPLVELKPSPQSEIKTQTPQPCIGNPIGIDYQSTKSSSNIQKYKKQSNYKSPPPSYSTATTDNSFKNSSILKNAPRSTTPTSIENNSTGESITNILKQVKLKKITNTDNFYCSCNEQQDKNINQICVICKGKGEVNGNHNMVKFIQYLMEFKMGLRGTYINNNNKNIIKENENKEELQIQQNTSIFQNNPPPKANVKNTITLSRNSSKQQRNSNKINQFCSQFIKQHDNNKSKEMNTTKKTIQTNQSTEITNNQSYIGGINLGINSMTESINNFNCVMGSNEKDTNEGRDEDREKRKNEESALSVFDQDSSEYQDQYYGGSTYNGKGKKLRFGCVTRRSINQQIKTSDMGQLGTRSMLYDIGRPKLIDARKSLPAQPFMSFQEFKQKIREKNNIHSQHVCDNCQVTPIQGTRYHCNSLMCNNDYDLCQKCYKKIGHKHKMQEIKNTPINQIYQNLEQLSTKSIRSSMKIPGGLTTSKVYGDEDENKIDQEDDEEYFRPIFKSSIH